MGSMISYLTGCLHNYLIVEAFHLIPSRKMDEIIPTCGYFLCDLNVAWKKMK